MALRAMFSGPYYVIEFCKFSQKNQTRDPYIPYQLIQESIPQRTLVLGTYKTNYPIKHVQIGSS